MEVRSETPFTLSMQKEQSMRLAYAPDGTAIYKPISSPSPFQTTAGPSSGGGNGTTTTPTLTGETDAMKKKRGRPRKYGPDGSLSPYLLRIGSGPVGAEDGLNSPSSGGAGRPVSSSSGNPDGKKRGRPPGSTNKKQHSHFAPLGSGGIGFTPHVITVKAGEDVSSKIMSFSENGPRAVCVLSANGAISNVTLQQAATFGRTVTYEGRFEILSLSGSYKLSESGSERSVLSVSLAGPDGRVLGGAVAGLLTAASPVQVIIGSFIAQGEKETKKKKKKKEKGPADQTNKIAPGGGVMGPTSPPSRGTVSESSGGPNSPFNQTNNNNNNINVNSGQPSFSGIHWK